MINLVFLVGLDIDPVAEDDYGEFISEELFNILSNEGSGDSPVVVTYCGDLNEWIK